MGNIWISGIGGGISSDEVTATRGDVLKGKTALTSDSNDEAAAGTLELTGNMSASDLLSGKTGYSTDPKSKIAGTMMIAPTWPDELTAQEMHCYGTNTTSSHDGNNVYVKIPKAGYYPQGTWIGFPEPDLIPANVKKGVSIGSSGKPVVGTFTGLGNAAAADVRKGKTFSTASLSNAAGTMAEQAGKTITPSTSSQVAIPANTFATGAVNVAAIPANHVGTGIPKQAAKTVTAGTSNVSAGVSGKYMSGEITIAPTPSQSKTVSLTRSTQTVRPDSGKFLSSVTIDGWNSLGTIFKREYTKKDFGTTVNATTISAKGPSPNLGNYAVFDLDVTTSDYSYHRNMGLVNLSSTSTNGYATIIYSSKRYVMTIYAKYSNGEYTFSFSVINPPSGISSEQIVINNIELEIFERIY